MTLLPAHSLSELIIARDDSRAAGTLELDHISESGTSWVLYRTATDNVLLEFNPDDGEV